jgi:hypothetical protein
MNLALATDPDTGDKVAIVSFNTMDTAVLAMGGI